jgi:2'-5' RNA ligase
MRAKQRLFVGVELSEPARAALAQALPDLRDAVLESALRVIGPERWHLTLQFLGSVEAERTEGIQAACALTAEATAAFEIAFAGVGAFRSARAATVIWIGVEHAGVELGALAERLMEHTERLGLERERRAYQGHLTIARIKRPCDVSALLSKVHVPRTAMTVEALTLFRSHLGAAGARYEPLARFALAGGALQRDRG